MTTITREEIIKDLEPFFQRRNLKESTKNNYIAIFVRYCNWCGKTIPELLYEAEQEQIPYINDKNQIILPNPEFTELKKLLNGFQDYQLEELSTVTVERQMPCLCAVYRELGNNIKIPTIQKFRVVQKNKTGLSQEKIIKAIGLSNLKYKTIITLLGSSGLRIGDLMRLTLQDWLNSIGYNNLDEAIYSESDIVGFLEFNPMKTPDILCQTFTSPESNNYVREYLKSRIKKGELLDKNSLLIKHSSKRQPACAVDNYFKLRNDKMYLDELSDIDKRLEDGLINHDEHEYLKERISIFKPHALRSYFITVVGNYINNLKITSVLAGHTLPEKTDKYYIKFTREDLEPYYLKVLPHLTFKEEVVVREVTTKDFEEMRQLKEELQERTDEYNKMLERKEYFKDLLGDMDKV